MSATALTEPVPDLSVVIVSYECRDHLERCLGSLLEERSRVPMEVVVVDNASTDGTVEMVRRLHPWVAVVEAGANRGFSWASNAGIRRSTAELVLLLNPDTVVPAGALSACVEEMGRRPEVGMLGCKLVQPDGTLDHACKRGIPTPGSSLAYMLGLHRRWPDRFGAYTASHLGDDEAGFVDAVNGAFMLVRRSAVDAVGLLDEDYWLYMEDLDWCLRFWEAGWPVWYWPAVEVEHLKGGSSGKQRSWRANHAFHRSMWVFYRKHQARERSRATTAAVWSAIWLRLGASAAASATRRRLAALRRGR